MSLLKIAFPGSTEEIVNLCVENVRLTQRATLLPVCVQKDVRSIGYFLIVQVML